MDTLVTIELTLTYDEAQALEKAIHIYRIQTNTAVEVTALDTLANNLDTALTGTPV